MINHLCNIAMKYVCLLILLELLCGCSGNGQIVNDDVVVIEIPMKKDNSEFRLSEFVDSISYVPLETNDRCLIGSMDKLIVTDRYYYVIDKETTSSIFCFDTKGKFIRKVGRKGVAEGEYVSITDVNLYNDKIYVLDSELMKLFIFTSEGDLEKEIKIDYVAESFTVIDDSWICLFFDFKHNQNLLSQDEYPNLLFLNIEDGTKIPDLYFDSKLCTSGIISLYANFIYDGTLIIPLNDTIYQVSAPKDLKRIYSLQFDDKYIDNKKSYLDKLASERVEAHQVEEYYQNIPILIRILNTDFYTLFFYTLKPYYYWGIYDKPSCKYIEASYNQRNPIVNDIDNIANFSPYAAYNNTLYGSMQPTEIKDKSSLWDNRIISEDDNPIITIMKLKDKCVLSN